MSLKPRFRGGRAFIDVSYNEAAAAVIVGGLNSDARDAALEGVGILGIFLGVKIDAVRVAEAVDIALDKSGIQIAPVLNGAVEIV